MSALLLHSKNVMGLNPPEAFLYGVCMCFVSSVCFSFLPQSKDLQVKDFSFRTGPEAAEGPFDLYVISSPQKGPLRNDAIFSVGSFSKVK